MLSKEHITKARRVGDLVLTFQWVNGDPSMCLLRHANGRKSAFVIGLSVAYKYTDMGYLVSRSVFAANHLGFTRDKMHAHKIADLILASLDDLVRMKPESDESEIERVGRQPIVEFDAGKRLITLHQVR